MSRSTPRGWGFIPTSTEDTSSPGSGPAAGYAAKHDPEVRFKEWKRNVNIAVQKKCGLDADDLEDCPYRDWFDSGMHWNAAANKAIKRSGGF